MNMKKYMFLALLSVSSVCQANTADIILPFSPIILGLMAAKSGYDFLSTNVADQVKKYYQELEDIEDQALAKKQKKRFDDNFDTWGWQRVVANIFSFTSAMFSLNCIHSFSLQKNKYIEKKFDPDKKVQTLNLQSSEEEVKSEKCNELNISMIVFAIGYALNYWHESNFKAAKKVADNTKNVKTKIEKIFDAFEQKIFDNLQKE